MGIGPILIFDKSTLQSLSVDEAVWLDAHYTANITPLFFVETLADLEKEIGKGRTPEEVVGNLAEKTPVWARANVHHASMCAAELLGYQIEMRRVPMIDEGRSVTSRGGRGLVFEQEAEIKAMQRWIEGDFLQVERNVARIWRDALSGLDMNAFYEVGQSMIQSYGRPRDLAEAKAIAIQALEKPGARFVRESLKTLLPEDIRRKAMDRWAEKGMMPIKQFAPYTAHVLTVDLFFCIALGADLISRERPSNKIDMAYLYYLPFCMIFTSSDRLHARTAPLFLTKDQVFVPGADLKEDLAKLDTHYDALPEEIKDRGVLSFAAYPPTEGDFLVSSLWDKLMKKDWREDATMEPVPSRKEDLEKISERIDAMDGAPESADRVQLSESEYDHVLFKHTVPRSKGKWQLLPKKVDEEDA